MSHGRHGASIGNTLEEGDEDDPQILGRRIWRIFPYVRPYRRRAMVGISTNMLARVFDLIPFVFIGFAVDYYSGISKSGGRLGDFRSFLDENLLIHISDNQAISYGILIFLGFAGLAIFQGISDYCWQTLGYKVQHDLRLDATHRLIRM